MGDFVQLVTVSTDRPVIDQTGITGYVDYDIHITTQAKDSYDDQSRAIVEAVKSQLGFKLESAKDPIEMLVVENVAKLAEN